MAVQAMIELGHNASVRQQRTAEGYTHDWLVFVRGCNREPIELFIEKVVFQLHDSFPKPKRVRHEPPYEVRESGYAGFMLPIVIYFRDGECLTLHHDLILKNEEPTQCARQVKLTFPAPTDKFRRLLMRAGGVNVSSVEQDSSHSPKQRSSAHSHSGAKSKSSVPLSASVGPSGGSLAGSKGDRKSKSQSQTTATSGAGRSKHSADKKGDKPPVNRVKEQFLNLFGTPIKKLSKENTSSSTTKQSSKSPEDSKKKLSKEVKSEETAGSTEKDKNKPSQSGSKEQKEKRSSKEIHRDRTDKKHAENKQSRSASKCETSGRTPSGDGANKSTSTRPIKYEGSGDRAGSATAAADCVEVVDSRSVKHEKSESCDAITLKHSTKSERKSLKEKKSSKKESKEAPSAPDNAESIGGRSKKYNDQSKHKPRDDSKPKFSLERPSSPQKSNADLSESTSKNGKANLNSKKDKKAKRRSDDFSKGVGEGRAASGDKPPPITVKVEPPVKDESGSTSTKIEVHKGNISSSTKNATDSVDVEMSSDLKSAHKTSQRPNKKLTDSPTKPSKKSRKRSPNEINDAGNKSKKSKSSEKKPGLLSELGTHTADKEIPKELARVDLGDSSRLAEKQSAQRRRKRLHADSDQERVSGVPNQDSVPSAADRSHRRRHRNSFGSESDSDPGAKGGYGSACSSAGSSPTPPTALSTVPPNQNPLRRLMNEVSSASELSYSEPPSPSHNQPLPLASSPPSCQATSSGRQQRRRVASSSSCASSSSLSSSSSSCGVPDDEKRIEKRQRLHQQKRKKRSNNHKRPVSGSSPKPVTTEDHSPSPRVSATPPVPTVVVPHQVSDSERLTPHRDLSIFTTEYLAELQHLQRRIMSSRDSDELGRVFELISATGLIEDNPNYYDFDLCALDQSVVRKLQQCLLMV